MSQSQNNIWATKTLSHKERYLLLFLIWRYESFRQCIGFPDITDSAIITIDEFTDIARDEAVTMLASFVERGVLVLSDTQVGNRTLYIPNAIYLTKEKQ